RVPRAALSAAAEPFLRLGAAFLATKDCLRFHCSLLASSCQLPASEFRGSIEHNVRTVVQFLRSRPFQKLEAGSWKLAARNTRVQSVLRHDTAVHKESCRSMRQFHGHRATRFPA